MDVEIDGAKELIVALSKFRQDMPRGEQAALAGCSDFLISKVRPLIPTLTGAARRSLVSKRVGVTTEVQAGGRIAPHFGWLDFGGRVGRQHAVLRPFIAQGRYLYPTLRKASDQFVKICDAALLDVAKGAGLDVH